MQVCFQLDGAYSIDQSQLSHVSLPIMRLLQACITAAEVSCRDE